MRNTELEVISPITGSKNVAELEQIVSKHLIENYWQHYNIDITYLLAKTPTVSIYKCLDSGYRFYYPFNIAGDDKFYRHFGKFEWYYLPWKWEHQQCAELVHDGDRVLEVGAGKGDFIFNLSKLKDIDAVGLELNSDAIGLAAGSNTKLLNQTIEEHAKVASGRYNMVCSFQVLEHVPNVRTFVQAMVKCLKPGGTLLISVPNNDSFIGLNIHSSRFLNMPPHHLGLWDQNSLQSLAKFFPIVHREFKIEPLQINHSDLYQFNIVKRIFFKSNFLVRVYWKLRIHKLFRPLIMWFANRIVGHSIIAIYEKN